MTAQGRKLQVIDFFKQCCLNATRGRERVAGKKAYAQSKSRDDDEEINY